MATNPLLSLQFSKDPTSCLAEFRLAIEALAGSLCVDAFEGGLASRHLHLTDAEYVILYPRLLIGARERIDRPVMPDGDGTPGQFALYREKT